MARVSFGSRAGGASDYLVGEAQYRQSTLNGVYGSLPELTDALRSEIEACTQSEVPELTTCELSIRDDATLPLLRPAIGPYSNGGEHDLPDEFKTVWTDGSEGYPGLADALPKAHVTSILGAGDGQPRQVVQRAASRAIVQCIEAVDGFKYSFNNAWAAKDDGGLRFSYICQDSMQNKDRHANGFTKTQKHLKGEGERGPRKPTYDCKGSISVKFSAVRNSVDIYYRHYAIHASVAERRPPPRPAPRAKHERVSSGRKAGKVQLRQEEDTGGLLGTLQAERTAYDGPATTQPTPTRPESSSTGKPLKRKRDSGMGPPPPRNNPNKPLSLADLLKQSEDARSPPPAATASPTPAVSSSVPPPVEYSLPSWQAPAPPPPPPPAYKHPAQHPAHGPSMLDGSRYAPPYQPQQYQPPSLPTAYVQPPAAHSKKRQVQSKQIQEYHGVPNKHQHGQGLFSTLKPVRNDRFATYEPRNVNYQRPHAKISCQNCRMGKKRCDEVRPLCGACARVGKLDCAFEGTERTYHNQHTAKATTSASSSPQVAPKAALQTSPQMPVQQAQVHQTATQPAMQQTPTYGAQQHSAYGTQQIASQSTMHGPTQYYSQQMSGSGGSSGSLQAGSQSESLYHSLTSQQTQQMDREGSPDPWYPQR